MKPKKAGTPKDPANAKTDQPLKAKPPKQQCIMYLQSIRKVQQECTVSIQDLRLHKMKESRGVL